MAKNKINVLIRLTGIIGIIGLGVFVPYLIGLVGVNFSALRDWAVGYEGEFQYYWTCGDATIVFLIMCGLLIFLIVGLVYWIING